MVLKVELKSQGQLLQSAGGGIHHTTIKKWFWKTKIWGPTLEMGSTHFKSQRQTGILEGARAKNSSEKSAVWAGRRPLSTFFKVMAPKNKCALDGGDKCPHPVTKKVKFMPIFKRRDFIFSIILAYFLLQDRKYLVNSREVNPIGDMTGLRNLKGGWSGPPMA